MFEILRKLRKRKILFFVLVIAYCVPHGVSGIVHDEVQSDRTGTQNPTENILDPAKYITVDEIRPGMDAYCLTCLKGTEIEKFALEVISVVRNINPSGSTKPGSRDAILVKGTDERFIHAGTIAGCSGSPVYINGRLAGALAFGWEFSKDPLYGVTPIEEMLKVGQTQVSAPGSSGMGYAFDFSKPIDFAEIDRQITTSQSSRQKASSIGTTLPCPLITSGLPVEVCERLDASVRPFGFMAIGGLGGGSASGKLPEQGNGTETVELVPGACLAVPLVTGDIAMTVIGTVTEVVDNKVYGFGHSFLGYGAIDLPMATGQVHTVVSTVIRSFKFASALEVVGALTVDESTAICGRIGAKAKMIPLTIKIDRYNDSQQRVYNCQVVDNRLLTLQLLRAAVAGAVYMLGDLPLDHMLEYKMAIDINGAEPVSFENISAGMGTAELIREGVGAVALLMNNPYKKVDIKSIDFDIRIVPKNIASHIWSVDLSDSKVKAGESIDVSVIVEPVLASKKKYRYSLKIPDELAPGKYDLTVCGSYGYGQFLRKAVTYKFIAQSLPGLIEAINNSLQIDRDKLYCLLTLPAGGVAVEDSELPDLPPTKTMVLQSPKRALKTRPYQRWLEKTFQTDTIVIDKKIMRITVEE